ncbi:MAG: DNA primase [Nitrospirae bacterium]|nr:DNA primase [Nitrospirota bacterium]
MKTDRLLEEIKSRTDIVDFISNYVQLKKSGQNWKGLCPFHAEKTPSFMVSPSKQMFHCFGCGTGGDVIAFVSRYENLTFQEAVKFLAGKAGISVVQTQGARKAYQRDEKIRHALQEATEYFEKRLSESPGATEYLKKRGIRDESRKVFRLGYAPKGWHNILKYLRGIGMDDATIKDAGLAVSGEKGLYDMFRHRLIFPITSASGHVIAFGGRALDESMPKYINSPETAVFRKSDTLFGLFTAKEEIRRTGSVIIVEGYVDVIACYQHGIKNVVAPLGTSLTPGQVQKLRTLAGSSILVFDGDAAGKAAAKRALTLIYQNNYKTKVLILPEDEDPDSYLRKKGEQAFSSLLANAKTMIDFFLGMAGGDRINAVREVLSLVAGIRDALAADEMLTELSEKTRMSETAIRDEFRKMKDKAGGQPSGRPLSAGQAKIGEEHLLLSAVISFPEKADYVLSRLDMSDLKDKTVEALFRKLVSLESRKDLSAIFDTANEEEKKLITRFSVEPGFDSSLVDRNIEDCFRRIQKRKLDEKIRIAQTAGDLKLINALLTERKRFMEEAGV